MNRNRWLRWLAAVGAMFVPATGCTAGVEDDERIGEAEQASGCGDGLIQDVELYDGTLGVSQAFVDRHQRPVGYRIPLFQWGPGCTGTMVSRDLFLSGGNCQYVVGLSVCFNCQMDGDNPPELRADHQNFEVAEVLEQQNDGVLNYALVRLAGSPGDTYGYTPILGRDQAAGSLVTLIQHKYTDQLKGIHAGPLLDYSSPKGANWFRHQVDTDVFGQGAGVLSPDGFIIGVNTSSGCGSDLATEGNSALRMTSLIAASPRLRHLANGDIALVGDFDDDGKVDDLGIWRPSTGMWNAKRVDNSIVFTNVQWGQQGDIPLVGDFDGDGFEDDLGIWRPSTGMWNAKRVDNSIVFTNVQWGQQGDIPLVGDFDGDGFEDDLGIWRPSTGMWNAKRVDNSIVFTNVQWGQQGDIPLAGDFDGDGKLDDLGIWHPSTGVWDAKRSDNTVIFSNVQWGQQGDIPLVGDFDGDGKLDDLGIYRPTTGMWNAKRSDNTVIFSNVQWGALEDFPLAGDFDGDGKVDDLGVWRPSTGMWNAKRSDDTVIFSNVQWGTPR